jgi:hypothetical protein
MKQLKDVTRGKNVYFTVHRKDSRIKTIREVYGFKMSDTCIAINIIAHRDIRTKEVKRAISHYAAPMCIDVPKSFKVNTRPIFN